MLLGSHAGEYITTKIYFCKKGTLKGVAEPYYTALVLVRGQIFQQLRAGKGLQPCTARASATGENDRGMKQRT